MRGKNEIRITFLVGTLVLLLVASTSAFSPINYVENPHLATISNASIPITAAEAAIVANTSIDAIDVNISKEKTVIAYGGPRPSDNITFSSISGPTQIENCGSVQSTWPPTDYVLLPPGSQDSEAYHVAVIGDSVAWGNGLCQENKYYYLVADWLRKVRNQAVEVKVYAHSGATIVEKSEATTVGETCENIDPAFSSGCPTLMDQANSIENAADVDLILVSGGGNDVGVMKILNYNTPTDEIHTDCTKIQESMKNLLNDLLIRSPNAKIIVTNYYPLVSSDTIQNVLAAFDFAKLLPGFWTAFGLGPVEFISTFTYINKVKENSDTFYQASTDSLRNAVTQANNGANRISLAETNFKSNNCYGAIETWLWELISLGPPPKTDDDMYDYRNLYCSNDIDRINAIGHPNQGGAKEYARAIEAVITGDKKLPEYVALRANNGQYVSAENGGGDKVMANRDQRLGWETFKLINLGNNYVALQAFNGQYLCAEGGGGKEIKANRIWINDWEKFVLVELGNENVALCANNGQYLCAEGSGGREVVANRNAVDAWETFKLMNLERVVALQAAVNNKYVSAENGGNDPLIANRDWIQGWETFRLIDLGNNNVALKADANEKIVCAETAGLQPLKANRDAIGAWETFKLVSLSKVAFQASNGQYLCVEGGKGYAVAANGNSIDVWETFKLIDLGNNEVALQAANGQYLCAEGSGGGAVLANRDKINAWETFKLIDLGDNYMAIKAAANNKYVCADKAGQDPLIANRDDPKDWETFKLIDLSADVCLQGCKYSTIQAAVDAANPGDTINVADGTYKENVHIDKSLTIKGAGADKTIVDGNQADSVFSIGKLDSNIDVYLSNMLIRGGSGVSECGGILNYGKLTVEDCTISGNVYDGIESRGAGAVTMKDTTVSGNFGHGILNNNNGPGVFTMESGTISGNTNGGVENYGTFVMNGGTISGNSANHDGGGVMNNFGTFTMNGGTISGNSAKYDGGGVENMASFTINGGTISGNSANNNGGGIDSQGHLFVSGKSQIINNQAKSGYGGGIYTDPYSDQMIITFDGTNVAVKYNKAHLPDTLPATWYKQYGVYMSNYNPTTTNGFDPATQVTDNSLI